MIHDNIAHKLPQQRFLASSLRHQLQQESNLTVYIIDIFIYKYM